MPEPYNNIYILGGHQLAYSYFEKITKAKLEGELGFENCYLVDPDPNCHATSHISDPASLISKPYAEFIIDYVDNQNSYHPDDTLIPDHTAKHVMLQVFLKLIEDKFPNLKTKLSPFKSDFETPFVHKSENDAIWAISYATWTCPPDCDEPKICPHIEDTRTWDFNKSLEELFRATSDESRETSTHRFPCKILYAEIAQIPLTKIIKEISEFMHKMQNDPPKKVIVATHSHCHGILGQFELI